MRGARLLKTMCITAGPLGVGLLLFACLARGQSGWSQRTTIAPKEDAKALLLPKLDTEESATPAKAASPPLLFTDAEPPLIGGGPELGEPVVMPAPRGKYWPVPVRGGRLPPVAGDRPPASSHPAAEVLVDPRLISAAYREDKVTKTRPAAPAAPPAARQPTLGQPFAAVDALSPPITSAPATSAAITSASIVSSAVAPAPSALAPPYPIGIVPPLQPREERIIWLTHPTPSPQPRPLQPSAIQLTPQPIGGDHVADKLDKSPYDVSLGPPEAHGLLQVAAAQLAAAQTAPASEPLLVPEAVEPTPYVEANDFRHQPRVQQPVSAGVFHGEVSSPTRWALPPWARLEGSTHYYPTADAVRPRGSPILRK